MLLLQFLENTTLWACLFGQRLVLLLICMLNISVDYYSSSQEGKYSRLEI